MTDTKYVIFSDGKNEFAVIFDRALGHKDVADGISMEVHPINWSKTAGPVHPVAAGFVGDAKRASESLKLGPRPQDADLLGKIIPRETPSAAPASPVSPSGEWVLVPREPTEAMLDALHDEIEHDVQTGMRIENGEDEYAEVSVLNNNSLPGAYRAMIAAAPKPAVEAETVAIVNAIFSDLRDRRFLKWLFKDEEGVIGTFVDLRSLDLDVQQEIRAAWEGIIAKALASPPGAPVINNKVV